MVPTSVLINQNIVSDLSIVVNKWFKDFSDIYKLNTLPQSDPACIHNEYIKTLIKSRENIMESSSYEENIILNQDISFDETEIIVKSLKSNKYVGIDCIPYECLKYHYVMLMMYKIFNHCFKNGIVPST